MLHPRGINSDIKAATLLKFFELGVTMCNRLNLVFFLIPTWVYCALSLSESDSGQHNAVKRYF
jgi:hypothetical protein